MVKPVTTSCLLMESFTSNQLERSMLMRAMNADGMSLPSDALRPLTRPACEANPIPVVETGSDRRELFRRSDSEHSSWFRCLRSEFAGWDRHTADTADCIVHARPCLP